MIVTELDKLGARLRLRRSSKRLYSEESLSALQRSLLKVGLQAHLRTRPLELACGHSNPGSFGIRSMMTDFKTGPERARRRAAAGRALKRLIQRGVLEHCARGRWRLTASGAALARRLYPQIKSPTKQELTRNIAFHKAWADAHPKRGRRRRS